MIKQNPFISNIFVNTWNKHFANEVNYNADFIEDLKFLKAHRLLPIFVNNGKHLTKGVSYTLKNKFKISNKNKVYLIYDVPQYFEQQKDTSYKNLRTLTVRQYPGFVTTLSNYKNFDDYLSQNFSKKSRYKFKSYKRKLEESHNITYVNYDHTTDKDSYIKLFDAFYELLNKRFEDKSESNNNLNPEEWAFYKDLVYPLMQNKQASLFAILDNDKPIAISLNYFSEDILFFAMTSFDIDYYKYNVGTVHLMELFKWCYEKDIKIFDFSKGYYDYKERWGDKKYDFENHIYYYSNSITSTALAYTIFWYFKLKQFLRDLNLNGIISKITFAIKKKKQVIHCF